MREIKFRAWDKRDHVMRIVYGVLFKRVSNKQWRNEDMVEMHCSDYEGSRAICLSHFERPLAEVDLMQFTGLKDKNGLDIFEGDVLKRDLDYKQAAFEEENVLVEWGDGFWRNFRLYRDAVVIGNIYENPELLDGNSS